MFNIKDQIVFVICSIISLKPEGSGFEPATIVSLGKTFNCNLSNPVVTYGLFKLSAY